MADNRETRKYTVTRKGMEPPSSVIWYIDCPFCGDVVKTYLWSLAGNGKKCTCGAKFDSYGNAYRTPEGRA